MRSLGWVLIQYKWYPYKRKSGQTHTEKKCEDSGRRQSVLYKPRRGPWNRPFFAPNLRRNHRSRTSGLQNCEEQIPISLSLWLLIVAAPANFIQPLMISCHTSQKIQTPYRGPQIIWAQPAHGRFTPRLSPTPPAWPRCSAVPTPAQAWPPRHLPRGVLSMTTASTTHHYPDLIFLLGTYWPLRLFPSHHPSFH